MSILDTIKNRTSCRTFKPVPLSPADKRSLEAFIRENDTGLDNERIPFTIIEKKAGEKLMKLDYGIIKGHCSYVMGASKAYVTSPRSSAGPRARGRRRCCRGQIPAY